MMDQADSHPLKNRVCGSYFCAACLLARSGEKRQEVVD